MVSRSFLFWSQECLLSDKAARLSALMWLRLHLITVLRKTKAAVFSCMQWGVCSSFSSFRHPSKKCKMFRYRGNMRVQTFFCVIVSQVFGVPAATDR